MSENIRGYFLTHCIYRLLCMTRWCCQGENWHEIVKLKFKSTTVSAAQRLFRFVADHHAFYRFL